MGTAGVLVVRARAVSGIRYMSSRVTCVCVLCVCVRLWMPAFVCARMRVFVCVRLWMPALACVRAC